MKLGIHQPYLFPYLGYFQLIHAVDTFVFLDDVAFRKQGWINRNRILIDGSPRFFSVPLSRASSFKPINQTPIDQRLFPQWRRKFLRTLSESYARSKTRDIVLALVEETLDAPLGDIGTLAARSVKLCCQHLGLERPLLTSSTSFLSLGQRGAARVVALCRTAGATTYVNAPGGRELYDPQAFARAGIALRFLEPDLPPYAQPDGTFAAGLSVLDLLLRVDRDAARRATRLGSLA
jgi:hypothetical protein